VAEPDAVVPPEQVVSATVDPAFREPCKGMGKAIGISRKASKG
jgi:hypothetical protein